MADVISVSELNHYVKTLLDVNDGLFDLALRGEIANFVQNARSGQSYPRPRSKSEGCRPEDPCSVNPLCCPPSKGCSGSGFKTLKPVCCACLLCSNAPLYSA